MLNNQIFFFFYNLAHHSFFFDKIVIFIAVYFPYVVIVLAGLFLIFKTKSRPSLKDLINRYKEFSLVFLSVVSAMLIEVTLKYIFHFSRPFLVLSNVTPLFPENFFSFPSGHATFFSALAFSIFFLNKKVGYMFIFFALLIGTARIISGVHFPVDILGGFVLGFIVVFIINNFVKI